MDKKENIKKILEKIQEAEYVLVGLGQYFDMQYFLSMQEGYREIIEKLQESHALGWNPMWIHVAESSLHLNWKMK